MNSHMPRWDNAREDDYGPEDDGTMTTTQLVDQIETELKRLDTYDTGTGGLIAWTDDEWPQGWVAVGDEQETVYGEGEKVLDALKEANGGESIDPDDAYEDAGPACAVEVDEHGHEYGIEVGRLKGDHKGYLAAWQALSVFPESLPEKDD